MATPVVISESQDTVSGSTGSSPTTTGAVPAGALVVVVLQYDNNTAGDGCSGITIGGNALTKVTEDATTATFVGSQMWYLPNSPAISSGATIAYTYASSSSFCFIAKCAYVTGCTASPLDVSNHAANASSIPSVASGVLSQASEIIFASAGKQTGAASLTEGSGFTTLGTFTDGLTADKDGLNFAYQNVSSTSSVSYAASYGASTHATALIAGFKNSTSFDMSSQNMFVNP